MIDDESLMPGARPMCAFRSNPPAFVVKTKFTQPGNRPLLTPLLETLGEPGTSDVR